MLALMTCVELASKRADNALLVMPMCHANSLFFFSAFVYAGAGITIFSQSSFDPALCLRTMGETGTTFTSLVPTHYTMMLDVPAAERGKASFDRVEKLMISSAPARADTKRAVMEMFPNTGLFELYGSTEGGWVTMLHPDEQFDKLGTVGRETIGSAPIRFFDEDGNEVPDGEPGELYSCNPYTFTGYWNNPEKTAQAFRSNYMSVGDIAYRDEDGVHQADRPQEQRHHHRRRERLSVRGRSGHRRAPGSGRRGLHRTCRRQVGRARHRRGGAPRRAIAG
jgi:fatty-acyl-CoA synthase